ncbi:hypothetical protein ACIQWR_17935 [Streptomyces sp. NPDC098789]|uniref:hypothetical protein n=1 Tax=Streptomyces sp. NPDC098789 TaxID=3366098 RepID=UPI0037F4DA39
MNYRFWCGECGFKTTWGDPSEAGRQHEDHYTARHPGLPLGGQVETGTKGPAAGGGLGCVGMVVAVVLLLIIAAACGR